MQFLPEERDLHRLPRQFIVNVLFTVVGNDIVRWVNDVVDERNQKVAEQKKMLIDLDPEIAKAFQKSTSVPGKCFSIFQIVPKLAV